MIVHASLRCNKVGNSLSMLACDDGVIQHEVVECLIGVLEVELNHFDAVSKSVKGHLGALSDSNVLLFVLLDSVARVQS